MKDRNENRPGYKKTKVGWIPEEWECKKLQKTVGQPLINGLFKRPDEYGSGTPLINVTDTYGNIAINPNKLGQVRASSEEIGRYENQHGDLFFVRSSLKLEGVGNCCVLLVEQFQTVFECHLIRVRPNKLEIDPLFMAYLCRSSAIRKQMLAFAQTTTMTTLPQNCIEQCLLPLPNISEQKKISKILSTWDDAIDKTRNLIEAKKQRKTALMQQLITGKKRLHSFSKPNGKKYYRYFDLPEDWACPQIKEIARECSERNTGRDDLPVLSCSKYLGFVESSVYFGKQVFSEDTSNYKVIRQGQFGFPSNHIEEGSIGLLQKHTVGLVSPIYIVFKCNENIVPEYLYAVFKTDTFKHIFKISTNASVDRRGSLRWKELSLIHVPMPSIKEQQAITEVLKTSDDEIFQLEAKLSALEKQKRGLMQKLLTGEVRVKP